MNPLLQRLYDSSPVGVQNMLLSAYSARLGRDRYGGRFQEYRELLEESQWWAQDRMRKWQVERLKAVLVHAGEHVPYYNEVFKHRGFDPRGFESLEQLRVLPVLTRDVVKHRIGDLRSRAPGKANLAEGHTSGTTGSPITLFYDSDMTAMNYAVMDRQYRWAGARLARDGDRVAVVRGNVIVPLRQRKPPFWRRNRDLNQLILSSFHLSGANAGAFLQALRDFRPTVIDGYPSSLFVLARLLLGRGETFPVKAAITSSETLYDYQRDAIEAAFCCSVFDYYAAAERVIFSVECEHHSGHHLCEEYGVTEVLDDNGVPVEPGEEGYLVGTTLHNLGMPLIRYRTTDRCSLRTMDCPCGRPLRLTDDVTTKAEDLLRLRDGRLIPPSVLTHPFKPLDSIEGSQLVQTDLDHLVVRIVRGGNFSEADREHLVRELRARLGDDMKIDIEFVDELPRTSRGKFKWVVSQVDQAL